MSVTEQAFTKHLPAALDLTEDPKAQFGGLIQIVYLMSYDSQLSW